MGHVKKILEQQEHVSEASVNLATETALVRVLVPKGAKGQEMLRALGETLAKVGCGVVGWLGGVHGADGVPGGVSTWGTPCACCGQAGGGVNGVLSPHEHGCHRGAGVLPGPSLLLLAPRAATYITKPRERTGRKAAQHAQRQQQRQRHPMRSGLSLPLPLPHPTPAWQVVEKEGFTVAVRSVGASSSKK